MHASMVDPCEHMASRQCRKENEGSTAFMKLSSINFARCIVRRMPHRKVMATFRTVHDNRKSDAHLPELDNLQGDEEGDGDKVRVEDPKGDEQDEGVGAAILRVPLHILVHGKLVSWIACFGTPDVGCHSAEHAHGQLQDDDEEDLEIQEVVVRACSTHTDQTQPTLPSTTLCLPCRKLVLLLSSTASMHPSLIAL